MHGRGARPWGWGCVGAEQWDESHKEEIAQLSRAYKLMKHVQF